MHGLELLPKRDWWPDLSRHFSRVTVGQMFRFMYSQGRLRELEKQVPRIFPEDSPKTAWRKALRGLWVRLCQFPERTYWRWLTTHVSVNYTDPANIKWPFEREPLLPHNDPKINNMAYLVDFFASAYGWSEPQILKLKWSAVNEYILAAEYRRVRERADLANATNLSDESAEIIAQYPKRDEPLTKQERAYINQLRYEERLKNRQKGKAA